MALQAPSGSNAQGWHFVVVTDAEARGRIAELYRRAFELYRASPVAADGLEQDDPARASVQRRVMGSAEHLAAHLHRVPVHVIPCFSGRIDGTPAARQAGAWGSILPAVWSFMLAARARGLGTSLTTLHLRYEREVAAVLGIPYDSVTQAALVPTAYTQGTDFRPASRRPLDEVLHLESW